MFYKKSRTSPYQPINGVQARSQDFAQGVGEERQARVGQIRVTTTYVNQSVVVILAVLDSKQGCSLSFIALFFIECLLLSSVSSSAQGGAMAPVLPLGYVPDTVNDSLNLALALITL